MLHPRLVAISGSLDGTVRSLDGGALSLGRDPSNHVMVGEPAVSRKHCVISQVADGEYEIADLESHNGTYVNGVKVDRTGIGHGDRIRIGTSEFVFLTGPDDARFRREIAFRHRPLERWLQTIFLDQRSGLPSNASGIGRMARDLSAFFKIASVINSTNDVETLQRELLVLISEVVPATRGAIALQPNQMKNPTRFVTGAGRTYHSRT